MTPLEAFWKRVQPFTALVFVLLWSCRDTLGISSGRLRDEPGATPTPRPDLQWDRDHIDFGEVTVGEERLSSLLTLTNAGDALGALPDLSSLPVDLRVEATTCGATLAAHDTCTVALSFRPSRAGLLDHTLAASEKSSLRMMGRATVGLSLSLSGDGVGSIEGAGEAVRCPSDCAPSIALPSIALKAVDDGDSFFGGWSGDCVGKGECSLELTAPRKVDARFLKSTTFALGKADAPAASELTTLAWAADGSLYAGSRDSFQFMLRRAFPDGSLSWERPLANYPRRQGTAMMAYAEGDGVNVFSFTKMLDDKTYTLGLHHFDTAGDEKTVFMRTWSQDAEGVLAGVIQNGSDGYITLGGVNDVGFRWLSPSGEITRRANAKPAGLSSPGSSAAVLDSHRAILTVGSSSEGSNLVAFVAKFSMEGTELWSKTAGSGERSLALCAAVDERDDLYVGGVINGRFSEGSGHPWLAKYDGSTGELRWQQIDRQSTKAYSRCALQVFGNEIIFAQAGLGPEDAGRANIVAVDADGNELWQRSKSLGFVHMAGMPLPLVGISSIAMLPNGTFAVGGQENRSNVRSWIGVFPR